MPDLYVTYADHIHRSKSEWVWFAYVLFEQPTPTSHLYTVECIPFYKEHLADDFFNLQIKNCTFDTNVNTPAVIEAKPTHYDSLIHSLYIEAKSKLHRIIDLDSLCNSLRKAVTVAYVSQLAAKQGDYYGREVTSGPRS